MAKGKKGAKGGKGGKKNVSNKQVQQYTKKVVADKTFGMKNKNKSKKVQEYVRNVEQTAQARGKAAQKKNSDQYRKKGTKQQEAARKLMMNSLLNVEATVKQVVLKEGQDPKTVLCAFFKAGSCKKGLKCKFSHDPNIARKGKKLDIYVDSRDEKKEETNQDWTEEQLREVVAKKAKGQKIQSSKTCKYFLEAVVQRKYGYFWECPNGGDKCHYRHALPEGFVLATAEDRRRAAAQEDENEEPLCDILERERERLVGPLTPVTLERFLEWKEKRALVRAEREAKEAKKRAKEVKAGKAIMSGREVFLYKPELFDGGGGGDDDIDILALKKAKDKAEEEEEEAAKAMEIDESLFE